MLALRSDCQVLLYIHCLISAQMSSRNDVSDTLTACWLSVADSAVQHAKGGGKAQIAPGSSIYLRDCTLPSSGIGYPNQI